MAEEDANRILSTFSVGFFMVAEDFILLTNLGLSMDGLGNFFTDLRALMTPWGSLDSEREEGEGRIDSYIKRRRRAGIEAIIAGS